MRKLLVTAFPAIGGGVGALIAALSISTLAMAQGGGFATPRGKPPEPANQPAAPPAAKVSPPATVAPPPAGTTTQTTDRFVAAACQQSLSRFMGDAIEKLKKEPLEASDKAQREHADAFVRAARSCTSASVATKVCAYAATVAVKRLNGAAKSFVATPLAGDALATAMSNQMNGLKRDIEVCTSVAAHPSEACREAITNGAFDIARSDTGTASAAAADAVANSCGTLQKAHVALLELMQIEAKQQIVKDVCDYKKQTIATFLRDYFDRRGTEADEDGDERARLAIDEVKYGDLRHGHTCDATPFFQRRCAALLGSRPAATDDLGESATSAFCMIRRTGDTDASLRVDLCGYDPSPQADLSLRVKYSCGGTPQKPMTLPGAAGKINILCGYPADPRPLKARDAPTTAALEAELNFFTNEPCPVAIKLTK